MASTFVNNLRLEEMATGEQSGNWGTKTNTNLELIGEALGFGTEGITTNANTHTTTVADASTDPGRAMFIKYTGTLDSACTITIAPNTLNRVHIIENGTSGSQNIIISQGSGANVTIAPGTAKVLYLDGAGSGAAVVDAFAHLAAVDLTVDDDLIVSDDVTLKSDSAVLGFGADTDTTLTHTDGTGLTLNSTNKLTFGDAASFVQQSSDGVLRIDGEATIDMNASTAVTVSNDLKLDSDAAVLGFGADNDVTLTHVADSALLLNDAIKMTFRDSALSVSSSTDGQLDIDADTEVEITAPTIDLTASTKVTVSNDVEVTGRASGTVTTNTNGQMDLSVSNHFNYTPSGNDEIELDNFKAGQSGTIFLDNSGGHTISVDSPILINADQLTAIATAGKYMLSYFCTVDQPNATLSNSANNDKIIMSVSGALT
jgi:hypothetical protein